jgi:hypothetical protein
LATAAANIRTTRAFGLSICLRCHAVFGFYLQHGYQAVADVIDGVSYALLLVAVTWCHGFVRHFPGCAGHGLWYLWIQALSAARQAVPHLKWPRAGVTSGMIRIFPRHPRFSKAIGDCSKVAGPFWAASIANWSFACFTLIMTVLVLIVRALRK